jgi:hypothetical protein
MPLPSSIEKNLQEQTRKLLIEGTNLGPFDRIRSRQFFTSQLFAPGLGGTIQRGDYEVFVTLAGGVGQGYGSALTPRETNWLQSGRLPDQQNLLTRAFSVGVRRHPTPTGSQNQPYPIGATFGVAAGAIDVNVPAHPLDVQRFMFGTELCYKYLTNVVPIGYCSDYPWPGGVYGHNTASRQGPSTDPEGNVSGSPNASTATRGYLPIAKNSVPAAFERRQKVPSLLQHGENFSMILRVQNDITLMGPHPQAADFPQLNDASGCLEIIVGFWGIESYVEKS